MANSTPMVDLESKLNSLRVKRLRRLDFPTPESPIRTTKSQIVNTSSRMIGQQMQELQSIVKGSR